MCSERETQRRVARGNIHLSGGGHLLVLRDPRDVPKHDPRAVSDRLDVDHARPASPSRILHLDIIGGGDEGGEDRRSELEDPFEGRVQVDVGG